MKRYPRTLQQSMRKKDERRKKHREDLKARKETERKRKAEELKRLKALKKKEIMDRIKKLQEITGNEEMGFQVINYFGLQIFTHFLVIIISENKYLIHMS